MADISKFNINGSIFNIGDDKVRKSIANNFDISTNYSINDLVLYDGQLYKFTSAHSAGMWDSSQVALISISDELKSKQNFLYFDTVPTVNSTNPVESGGVKSYVDSHDDFKITGTVSSSDYTLTDARINDEHWEVDWVQFLTPSNVLTGGDWTTDIVSHTVTLSATYNGSTNVIVNMHWVQ